jgi:hypothetical protein
VRLLHAVCLLLLQRWKSNPMYWCELCRVWMNDSKAAKFNHENGVKHKENLARSKQQHSSSSSDSYSSSIYCCGRLGTACTGAAAAFCQPSLQVCMPPVLWAS